MNRKDVATAIAHRFNGLPVIVHPILPITPTLAEDTVRQVRHGLANVLKWLGEDVGPEPGAKTHIIIASDMGTETTLFVSAEFYAQIEAQP